MNTDLATGFTFAVMGHNEADRLHVAVGQALEAAQPGDSVWFVDSASTDGSGALAAALGAEVVDAPLGKGRAMTVALEQCHTPYICFVDGDLESSDHNIPATLRAAVETTGADMVVGSYTEANRRYLLGPGIYLPMMRALLPDVHPWIVRPLSGQRALRVAFPRGQIPPDYGVEAHLNMYVGVAGGTITDWDIGRFQSPSGLKPVYLAMSEDVANAILEVAQTWGRLPLEARPEWDAWVAQAIAVMNAAGADEPDATVLERIDGLAMPTRAPTSR